MEVFFDGSWLALAGKSGIHFNMYIPAFFFVLAATAGLVAFSFYLMWIAREFRGVVQKSLGLTAVAFGLFGVGFLPIMTIISAVCDPIQCSLHPRHNDRDTWMISPRDLLRSGYVQEGLEQR